MMVFKRDAEFHLDEGCRMCRHRSDISGESLAVREFAALDETGSKNLGAKIDSNLCSHSVPDLQVDVHALPNLPSLGLLRFYAFRDLHEVKIGSCDKC